MLREQTSSMKCSQTWAKTSTGEAKEPVENERRQCVDFGWATLEAHTLCWEFRSRVALTRRWSAAQRIPLVGLRGGWGTRELNHKTTLMNPKQTPSDPSPQPDIAKKPCTEAARGAVSAASKTKAEDLSTLMSVSPFSGWSPFKKFVVISSKGSAKVADRSPFKIHRELKSFLGDETIQVVGCWEQVP
ncbi:hypothetical protein PoB_004150700 [Plakobranchus ocellatus]|uniref:Uncharacterized protein n=1 Tax=Plakobranchus ocellatus TaxID=259542 RepID=A0AAV4B7D4_9GAST|nr:hypothetical protein PoB_004150700 [Plakobranchus ocellatus]